MRSPARTKRRSSRWIDPTELRGQMSQHLWSGRFDSAPDPAAFDFGVSFPFDRRLFEDDVTGSLAWAEALVRGGVLTARRRAGHSRRPDRDSGAGPSKPGLGERRRRRRAQLRRAAARGADWRCRPAFAHRPVAQRAGVRRSAALPAPAHSAAAGEAARASSRRSPIRPSGPAIALMPSYTHMRRAMPVLVVALPAQSCRRAAARSRAARGGARGSQCAAARVGRDRRHRLRRRHAGARRDGWASRASSLNSMDASSDRDFAAGFLHACALSMVHLSRIAEDFILLTSEEFGFFELADSSATGSSMMPQKKNPDPLELVRGKSGRADRPSHRTAGHDEGPADRLQQGSAGRQGAALRLRRHARRVARGDARRACAPDAAPGAHARAASGLLLATDVADYLVSRGMPFRQAHEVVGGDGPAAAEPAARLRSAVARRMAHLQPALRRRRAAGVTAAASVRARKTPQSTSPDAVRHALAEAKDWLSGSPSTPRSCCGGSRSSVCRTHGLLLHCSRPLVRLRSPSGCSFIKFRQRAVVRWRLRPGTTSVSVPPATVI